MASYAWNSHHWWRSQAAWTIKTYWRLFVCFHTRSPGAGIIGSQTIFKARCLLRVNLFVCFHNCLGLYYKSYGYVVATLGPVGWVEVVALYSVKSSHPPSHPPTYIENHISPTQRQPNPNPQFFYIPSSYAKIWGQKKFSFLSRFGLFWVVESTTFKVQKL